MIGALTISLIGCVYLYSKQRQSQQQIQTMIADFDKLKSSEPSVTNLTQAIAQNPAFNSLEEKNLKLIDELKNAKAII